MPKPAGIPYSVNEARLIATDYVHLDKYVRDIINWLCDRVEAGDQTVKYATEKVDKLLAKMDKLLALKGKEK